MLHSLKRFWLLGVMLLWGGQSVFGFSLLGPLGVDTWQTQAIGYFLPGDIGGPKNLGEGYRWNTRNIYYAYDANFLDYFGSNGVVAADQAFAVFNNLTNLSSYSADLSEWPIYTERVNFRAQTLQLLDVKSIMMHMLIEELGLTEPDRYVWTLHDRTSVGSCPAFLYQVVQRNFDPVTYQYSPYINDILYDYEIQEYCVLNPNPFSPISARTATFAVDPSEQPRTENAVANLTFSPGGYFTGLTRDDVGGLRYLYSTNRINVESVAPNALQIFTNTSNAQLLTTSNLSLFIQQTQTNNSAALLALYPNLVITSVTNYFTNVVTTNITATFVHVIGAPAGSITVQFTTNYSTNVGTRFSYTFANVVTNTIFTNGFVTTAVTNVGPLIGGAAGSLTTNVVSNTVSVPFINGDFYIIPNGSLCGNGYQILSTQLVQVIPITNVLSSNTFGATGIATNQTTTFNQITYYTNHSYIVYPIQCLSNSVALREGVDKLNFIRRDFDALLGSSWTPVTNNYTINAVSNTVIVQNFQRIVTQPDMLVSAADLVVGRVINIYSRSINFNSSNALPRLSGPGTIEPPVLFQFNKVGPIYLNNTVAFLDSTFGAISLQSASSLFFQFGSFDGTTNDPVVYPDGTSLANLEAQVLFQITTSLLPDASVSSNNAGNVYSYQLTASGASPPYTWSLATNSPGLPNGLSLSSSGVISGVPTVTGTFDFTVQATDIGQRTTAKDLFIQVDH